MCIGSWRRRCLILIAFVLWQKLPQKPQARGATAQVVRVMKATRGDMPVILNELGTVTPTATVTVMPNQAVSGYLVDVPFQEGQDVQKGQVLARDRSPAVPGGTRSGHRNAAA